jgi:hypothetical protein
MADHAHPRHLFIDLFRSAAILLMLEGHVFRTFLPLSLQQTGIFMFHEIFHGLSAPAFLFGSGLTFVISTRRRWEDYHHWGPPLARRVRRLLFVILLGLFLHLPYFSFRKVAVDASQADLLQLFQCDVLLCIGIGLLSLHGLVFFFKTERRFYGLVLATILSACLLTPLVWDVDFLNYLPPYLAQLANSAHGSPFPLFPYVGFLFAGVIVSWEFTVAMERKKESTFMRQLFLLGAGIMIGGYLVDLVPVQIYPTYNFWYTSPSYFFLRLGSLMVMLPIFWAVSRSVTRPGRAFTVFGKESLFVYVLHLLILSGSVVNVEWNLRAMYGERLSVGESFGVFAVLTALLLGLALAWEYCKDRQPALYRFLQLGGVGTFLWFFFRNEF